MTQAYTNSRQYYMLDDLVEATSAAKKVPALDYRHWRLNALSSPDVLISIQCGFTCSSS